MFTTQDLSSNNIWDWEHQSAQIVSPTHQLPQFKSSSFFSSCPRAPLPTRNTINLKLTHQGRQRSSTIPFVKFKTHTSPSVFNRKVKNSEFNLIFSFRSTLAHTG
ncbi:hypothetical protein ILYODFUR_032837 [Ilyodon furcidens]|uniref:Uncharacterized protein n=1 Tax=Ilyodon furcidens TaxID=33524 RepID=A0ABV0ST94_9TELE